MGKITFLTDTDGVESEAKGSDGRLNVSSRSDSRAYYNSRDKSESYALTFDDANATANDYIAYLKNTKTDGKHLVIRSVGVNCEAASAVFKLTLVSGTPTGGTTPTIVNLNQGGVAKTATVTALSPVDSSSTPMTMETVEDEIDIVGTSGAFGHEEFRLGDQLRIGQDQAIAIELDAAAASDTRCYGVIYFYFE